MKILFDHQAFTYQYYGGVSKCFCELIKHFGKEVSSEIAILQSENIHLINSGLKNNLKPVKMDFIKFARMWSFPGRLRFYKLLNILPFWHSAEKENLKESIRQLKKGKFDIFHPTFFDDYFLPYLDGKPFVITVHDMITELYPEYFGHNMKESKIKKKLCDKATAIIAVSNQTKKDLVRLFDVNPEKVSVIYHGGPQRENIVTPPLIKGEYILYVGQRSRYKNFKQTLKDFKQFSERYSEVKFVCTGGAFNSNELTLISQLALNNKVFQISATESEMKNLYSYALAFIYPSLYEGFGMPILEAFAYGCPVILNNKSCFPEVGGNAAFYFESDGKSSNLSLVLQQVYTLSETERIGMINKGYNRLDMFTWEKASEKLEKVYKEILINENGEN